MMKPLLDVHTHTLVSGHAFSTVAEMMRQAQELGLEILGITEHGPSIPGSCHPIYFQNLHVVPRQWGNTRLLLGAEINILDTKGNLDLSERHINLLDLRIAGVHKECYTPGTAEECTAGVEAVIRNPKIHIISHPGDGAADLIYEPLVKAAKECHTLLEINNTTFKPARNLAEHARPRNIELLKLCKQYEVPVILGSDAHITFDIANYEFILPLLAETEFPDQLVMNYHPKQFLTYLGL